MKIRNKVVGVLVALGAAAAMFFGTAAPASATVYNGTVNCSGGDVVGIYIEQSGNSGWATRNSSGSYSTWSYNFNNNDYRIVVGCGGTPQVWGSTNKGPWTKPWVGSWDYICYNTMSLCYKS